MHPYTLAGFQDELQKIADNGDVVESGITRAGSMRIEDEKNNPSWKQTKEPALQNQKPHSETPASKANAFFGLPLGPPRKRNVRQYEDQGSAAAQSPDRSQAPIDAQSSANISSGGAMYPATGPGGV